MEMNIEKTREDLGPRLLVVIDVKTAFHFTVGEVVFVDSLH